VHEKSASMFCAYGPVTDEELLRIQKTYSAKIPQDGGKAQALETFIKAKPLFVAGNSRGDMEMMNESVGLKLIVNPDGDKIEKGSEAGLMNGYTVKSYWEKNNALIVNCNDVDNGNSKYISGD
jgi:hypothetical protein